jgi:hypothetical protein
MSDTIENITIDLFGLERELWEKTSDGEKNSYNRTTICFMVFLLLACVASCMLVYLITGHFLSALPGGILASLIIGSIVRFSMIILRRSIFDELKAKQQVTPPTKQTAPATVTNQAAAQAAPAQPAAAKSAVFRRMLGKFKFKWPGAQSKVPGFAGFIRLVIMTVMGLLVLFPLVTLLHKSAIEELNDAKRQYYLQEFEKDGQMALANSLTLLNREKAANEADLIKNAGIYQADGLVREKKLAIARIDSLIVVEKADHAERYALQLEHFKEELDGQYFLSLTFRSVVTMPFFPIALALIAFLLVYPHFLLYRLKTNQVFVYSALSTGHYRKIIDMEYKDTTTTGYAHLEQRFGYKPKGYDKDVYWENTPYNTEPHKPFAERKPMTKEKFLESFEPKTTA